MKLLLTILSFIFSLQLSAQVDPVGKQFIAKISEACKLMRDGGCSISTTYCTLNFQKDSVAIVYFRKASCTPKEREKVYERAAPADSKSYTWKKKGNTIIIKGFNDYGPLSIDEETLTGKIEKNRTEALVFKIRVSDEWL